MSEIDKLDINDIPQQFRAAVKAVVDELIGNAPGNLNTLGELSLAIQDNIKVVDQGADPDFPRPVGASVVYWTGSVEPNNAINTDLRYVIV